MLFDIDNWSEIFSSMRKNRLQTFLTGFSISWGIFMFVILLATSNGVRNGIMISFEKRAFNIVKIQGRVTSIPYKGFPDNRKVELNQKDFDLLDNRTPEKEYLSALIPVNVTFSYEDSYATGECTGIYPEYAKIGGLKIQEKQGRLISEMDMKERRKVVILNQRLKEVLYKHENPVGRILFVNNLKFTVVGVYSESAVVNIEKAYIPFTTAQALFSGGYGFKQLIFSIKNLETNKQNDSFIRRLRGEFADIHQYNVNDKAALSLSNNLRTYLQTVGIINAIVIFIWVIGIGSLFAGIVGISNIMLIAIRERTREYGIRKALGATPSSILQGIILEAVCITSIFGYLGLFAGICVNGLFNSFLKSHADIEKLSVFKNPMIDLKIAVGAMIILIIAGILAGYFPARHAVRITPVESMRAE